MTASFGIDHPLIATHDIEGLRARLTSLGFTMTGIGHHPWGTSTSLAMFQGCLIEIMGVHDESLLDQCPAGDFRFGRHVHTHLQMREGVALTALHSTDSAADAERAARAGYDVAGHLDFGRDVTLPDGRRDRTKTTLALLPDAEYPRLSFFLCQQHRPELIYVAQWLTHPNTACGIAGVTIRAEPRDQIALRARLEGLYGPATDLEGGFGVQTANGVMRVLTQEAVEAMLGPLPAPVATPTEPAIIGMDIAVRDIDVLADHVAASGMAHRRTDDAVILTDATRTGNTVLRFLPANPLPPR